MQCIPEITFSSTFCPEVAAIVVFSLRSLCFGDKNKTNKVINMVSEKEIQTIQNLLDVLIQLIFANVILPMKV